MAHTGGIDGMWNMPKSVISSSWSTRKNAVVNIQLLQGIRIWGNGLTTSQVKYPSILAGKMNMVHHKMSMAPQRQAPFFWKRAQPLAGFPGCVKVQKKKAMNSFESHGLLYQSLRKCNVDEIWGYLKFPCLTLKFDVPVAELNKGLPSSFNI